MSDLAFSIPPVPLVPVLDGGSFPVRRILCVGRNYAAHRAEMGGDDRDPPRYPPGQKPKGPTEEDPGFRIMTDDDAPK